MHAVITWLPSVIHSLIKFLPFVLISLRRRHFVCLSLEFVLILNACIPLWYLRLSGQCLAWIWAHMCGTMSVFCQSTSEVYSVTCAKFMSLATSNRMLEIVRILDLFNFWRFYGFISEMCHLDTINLSFEFHRRTKLSLYIHEINITTQVFRLMISTYENYKQIFATLSKALLVTIRNLL